MNPSDPILGPPRGSASDAMAFGRRVGAKRVDNLAEYLACVYDVAPVIGIDPSIVVAQSALETDNWRDPWWNERLNPAGIGITGDPEQNAKSRTWTTGFLAAYGQLVHLWLYTNGWPLPEPLAPYAEEDPRRDAIPRHALGVVRTLADLGERWAVVPDYGERIARRAADIFPEPTGGTGMALKAYRFPGLAADVMLPDDIIVEYRPVGTDKCGWVRSCAPNHPRKTTFHDTGTPGADADHQQRYLNGGPSANGQRRQVGFNFAADHRKIVFLTPLDEDTWAAGTPSGNDQAWHVEMCFGGIVDFEKSLRTCIMLHAGLIAAKGWSVDTALVQHNYWSGKDCPRQVRNRGRWPEVQRRVAEQVRVIKAGGAPATDGVIDVGDIVATTDALNIRSKPTTTGSTVLATIPAGGEALVTGETVDGGDSYQWLPVKSTISGTTYDGFVATNWVVLVRDAEEEPDPVDPAYFTPVAIPELAPYVGQQQVELPHKLVLKDDTIAIPVYDRVRATKATPRSRYAEGTQRVGPDLNKDDEFDVSFLLINPRYPDTYVTPWWTRVNASDCVIVSDTPKDIRPAPGGDEGEL